MAEPDVNPVVSEEKDPKEVKVDPELPFKIFSRDDLLLWKTNPTELDDCFYSIIALMSWTKTFEVGSKLKLTFTTITDDDKMALLASMRKWAETNDASSNMFDQQLNKTNLANYLTYIEVDGNAINLREKKLEERMLFLGTQVENTLSLYGTYLYVFLEIIRRAMTSQVSLKNS